MSPISPSQSPCRARRFRFEDARNLYVARTYAYVAAGKQGMAIVDVEHPSNRGSIRCSTPAAQSKTPTT